MPPTSEQLIQAGKKAMAANDIEAANEIADMLDAMGEEPAAPAAPVAAPVPGADARAEYLASFKLERELPFGAKLMRGPDGNQVLIAQAFTTSDPDEIAKIMKPYDKAAEFRAEAARLRKMELQTRQLSAGIPRPVGVKTGTSTNEVAAMELERKALRAEGVANFQLRNTV